VKPALKTIEKRATAADECGSVGDGEYLDFQEHAVADVKALVAEVRRLQAQVAGAAAILQAGGFVREAAQLLERA
jgi:hypothetical protein